VFVKNGIKQLQYSISCKFTRHSTFRCLPFTIHATFHIPLSSLHNSRDISHSTFRCLPFTIHATFRIPLSSLHNSCDILHSAVFPSQFARHSTFRCLPFTIHATIHCLPFTIHAIFHIPLSSLHNSRDIPHSAVFPSQFTRHSTFHSLPFTITSANNVCNTVTTIYGCFCFERKICWQYLLPISVGKMCYPVFTFYVKVIFSTCVQLCCLI
jgi:hypothetical protein